MKQSAGSFKRSIKLTNLSQSWQRKNDRNHRLYSIAGMKQDISIDPPDIRSTIKE